MILEHAHQRRLRRAVLLWFGMAGAFSLAFGLGNPPQGNPTGSQAGRQSGPPPDQASPNQAGTRGQTLQERRDMIMQSVNGVRMPNRPTGVAPPQSPAGGAGPVIIQPSPPGFGTPARPMILMSNRPGVAVSNQSDDPPSMRLRMEGQDVTAEIRNVSLQSVLDELSAWSGVVFEVESQDDPKVSINLYHVTLQEAVQRLTANHNSVDYFGHDETGQDRLNFVRVISRTPRPAPPVLRYIGTGAVTKRIDEIVDSPEQALAVLAGSTNLVARQKAIDVLVATKSAVVIEILKAVLNDPDVEVRVAAIDGLASLGARDALPDIMPALKDAHPGVRQCAVLAIGMLGDKANVKDVRPLLHDEDPNVAASAGIVMQKLSIR